MPECPGKRLGKDSFLLFVTEAVVDLFLGKWLGEVRSQ